MSSTEELVEEHNVIQKVLDALERHLADASRTRRVPTAFLRGLIMFSRQFIEKCHHGKEEACLFPCLEKRGIPRQGPIEVMLQEHQAGRLLINQISLLLDRYDRGEASFYEVLNPCQRYLTLLREHIRKENHMLFPMGDSVMTREDNLENLACFEEKEREMGESVHQKLLDTAEELSES